MLGLPEQVWPSGQASYLLKVIFSFLTSFLYFSGISAGFLTKNPNHKKYFAITLLKVYKKVFQEGIGGPRGIKVKIKAGVKEINCLVGLTKQSQSVFNQDNDAIIACCEAKLHH
jgi:hypothetical protein